MRKWTLLLAGVALLLVAASVRLFVVPSQDRPGTADAVVLLAGDPETRIPLALSLAEQGAGVLVVSTPPGEVNDPARALCNGRDDIVVHCFTPPSEPSGTRGEAQALARVVDRYGWDRITVVTSSYHLQRAGVLIRRCVDAEVSVVAGRPNMSLIRWGGAIVHEVGGLVAAALDGAC